MGHSLAEIAAAVSGRIMGNSSRVVHAIAPLDRASKDHISFLSNDRYQHYLAECKAAVMVTESQAENCGGDHIVVDDPYLAYAQISPLFDTRPVPAQGVHPSAVVSADVVLGDQVSIGAHAVLEPGVIVGAGTSIGAGSVIGAGTVIGCECRVAANVSIMHSVLIGDQVQIESGAVIGADGFGFAPSGTGWQKIHQLGTVKIGDKVYIGASTTIDRGALDDTVICDGVIIDNQVQIAHNVVIGENTALAGCVGIAGSAVIGANCSLGGGVGVAGHLSICDNVHLTGMTLVSASIKKPGQYSSGTAMSDTKRWRKNAVRFLQLDELARKVRALESESSK